MYKIPIAVEQNLPPENCPKQLLSTEELVYELSNALDASKSRMWWCINEW